MNEKSKSSAPPDALWTALQKLAEGDEDGVFKALTPLPPISKCNTTKAAAIGRLLARRGMDTKARGYLKKVWSDPSATSKDGLALVDSLQKINLDQDARKVLNEAEARFPNDAEVAWRCMVFDYETCGLERTREVVKAALENNSDDLRLLKMAGIVEFRLRNFDEAIAYFHKLLGIEKNDVDSLILIARSYAAKKKQKSAFAFILKAIRKGETSPRAYKAGIVWGLALGHHDQTLELGQRFISSHPEVVEAWKLLGRIYNDQDNRQMTLATRQFVMQMVSDDVEAISEFADALFKTKNNAKAEQQYFKVIAMRPEDRRAYGQLIKIYIRQNNTEMAEDAAKCTIELFPDFAEAYADLGAIYVRAHRHEESMPIWRRAISLNPQNVLLHIQLTKCLITLNKLKEALHVVQKGLDRFPGNKKLIGLRKKINQNYIHRKRRDAALGRAIKSKSIHPTQLNSSTFRSMMLESRDIFHALLNFSRSVRALMLLDTAEQQAKEKYGYLSAFITPIWMFGVLYLIRGVIRDRQPSDMSLELFILTGLGTWNYFNANFRAQSNRIKAYRKMANFPAVSMWSSRVAAMLMEYVRHTVVLVLGVILLKILGIYAPLHDLPQMIVALGVIGIMGFALGIIYEFAKTRLRILEDIVPVLMRMLFLTSGIFISLDELPQMVKEILWYNPVLHAVEFVRNSFLSGYPTDYADWNYLFLFTIGAFGTALLLDSKMRTSALTAKALNKP